MGLSFLLTTNWVEFIHDWHNADPLLQYETRDQMIISKMVCDLKNVSTTSNGHRSKIQSPLYHFYYFSTFCVITAMSTCTIEWFILTSTFENRSKFCFCLDLNVNFVAENNEELATTKTLQKVFRCNSVLPLEKFF